VQQFDTVHRAALERTKGAMNKIAAALASYMSDNGQYPAGEGFREIAAKLTAYDRMLPVQDAWDNDFRYSSTGESYTLTSAGFDGQVGTEDDLVMKDGQFSHLPKVARPGG
jgi:hypothetical protein